MKGKGARQLVGVATAGAGATLVATAASACCVPILAPLLVSLLGVTGSIWAAGLKPYSLYIVIAAGLLLGYGFWSVYRRRVPEGTACPVKRPISIRVVLWISALLWLLALILNVLQLVATNFG